MNTRTFYTSVCSLLFGAMLLVTGVQAQDPAPGTNDTAATAATDTAPGTDATEAHASLPGDKDAAAAVLPEVMSDSVIASAAIGKMLFTGEQRLENRGPSCLSCHNVASKGVMDGGLLAKDLTHVHKRMGDAGLEAIIGNPPFPAMARAYENKSLTAQEVLNLQHFFRVVEQTTPAGEPTPGHATFLLAAGIGLIVWMGLIFIVYSNRKTRAVKQDIFDRQVRPVN